MKNVNIGMVIGAGTLLGIGIGQLFGNVKAFMFIGMGTGLLAAVAIQMLGKNEEK